MTRRVALVQQQLSLGTVTLACNDLDEDEPVATGVGPV
jgi:chaperonin cofactor prefoldin